MNFDELKYIAIEGVIGAGKTSLAKMLSDKLGAKLVLEDADNNPFLAEFYKNKRKYAFQTQMFFLVERFKEYQEFYSQQDLFSKRIISDYMFRKDRIFANLTLDDNELSLYSRVADVFEEKVRMPDYIIYLQATTDVLMERIKKRGRNYEKTMERSYIQDLNDAYNHFFLHYTESPLLIVDTSDLDFIKNIEDAESIISEIKNCTPGVRFVKPMGYDTLRLNLD